MGKELKDIVNHWIMKAENDLKTAEQIFKSDPIITDTLCFHCQQTAEKYLKAFLIHQNVMPEKTHKIEQLLEACLQFDPSFEILKEAVLLTEYAVEIRYPDGFLLPSIDEAKEAYHLALTVKEFVNDKLK